MKMVYWLLAGIIVLGGCAANTVYVNPQKTAQEIKQDEEQCQAMVDASDFKKECLRDRKYDECMKDRGYKLVAEEKVNSVKGFKEAWVDPDTDFKVYEVLLIDNVDVSQAKVKNMQVPGSKVTDKDIDDLGQQMFERFSRILNAVLPVVSDKEEARGKKTLHLTLKLNDIAQTNVGMNAAMQVIPLKVPLPFSSKGLFSFEGTITDFLSEKKLIAVSDKAKSDKNASLVGLENFEKWKHAYNTMDYWADCLAKLLSDKRGEPYKSQLKLKVIAY